MKKVDLTFGDLTVLVGAQGTGKTFFATAFAAAFFATLFGSVASPAITTAIQNESPPALRATAASLATITVSVLGIALAPFLVGVLSDQLTPAYGKESLRIALLISLGGCLFAAALHYRVATLFKTDNAV